MNRRSLLALLGIAPAVVAAPKLLSASTLGTHTVLAVPNLQCGRCGDAMNFEPFAHRDAALIAIRSGEPILSKCYGCGVIVAVDVPRLNCRVAARDGE